MPYGRLLLIYLFLICSGLRNLQWSNGHRAPRPWGEHLPVLADPKAERGVHVYCTCMVPERRYQIRRFRSCGGRTKAVHADVPRDGVNEVRVRDDARGA